MATDTTADLRQEQATDRLTRAVTYAATELHDLTFEQEENRQVVRDLTCTLKTVTQSLDRLTLAVERATARL